MTCVEATPLVSRARLTTRRAAHSVWCHTAQEMTWMLPRKRVSLFEPPRGRTSRRDVLRVPLPGRARARERASTTRVSPRCVAARASSPSRRGVVDRPTR
eukprot:31258-Pelagococcus_subviridis.AAC.3